jgi:UDP-N-acetylmuramoyl-tripeptide--D-alanyl-D-alanine ligase
LFWIYLWQLKEYHIPRLLDHFRTEKGKKLIWGALPIVKIVLLFLFFVSYSLFPWFFYVLTVFYAVESALFAYAIFKKTAKKPVLTFKTIFLTGISVLAIIGYLVLISKIQARYWYIFALLVFDILTPLIISAIVLVFQPLFVFSRNQKLEEAKQKLSQFQNLTVIGITGSYGKTSTKEFLATILSEKFNVLATEKHKNSEMGIAQTILEQLKQEHQILIVEMGAYRKGGIDLLCDMARPKIGIVTGVNEQHLALFGSIENLLSAEGGQEMAGFIPKDGTLIVNGDNKYCIDLYKRFNGNKKIYSVGNDKINSDAWTEEALADKEKISFLAIERNGEMAHFNVNVLGLQNIQNLLAAALAARHLGMSLSEIAKACEKIKPDQGGITLLNGKHGIDIIDSSYSANPTGVVADLNYLRIFPNKKVIIMPCLIELGEKSQQIHFELGKKIGQICDMAIVTTKERFEDLKNGAINSGMQEKNILLLENPNDIFALITTFCTSGDAVLLEGRVSEKLKGLLI